MMGYFKDPEQTSAVLRADGFLRTGDMGTIDRDGRLRITGRVKELFKTAKGKYVAPVPIENLLCADPLIEAACVTGNGAPQPTALVMLDTEAARSARASVQQALEALLARVNAALEAHEQLDCLVVVAQPWTMENGLLTPTLKIRRNLIEERYAPRLARWAETRSCVIWE
jgi:long-chain acyl-CoA synthetase